MTALSPSRTALLDRLRVETRDEHLAIEDALGLMRPDLSLAGYRQVLRRFLGFYEPIEERIAAVGGPAVATHTKPRTAWLAADLVALGEPAPSSLPRCRALPELRRAAQVWGCLYVLEGASLGGQIIGRHFEHALGITPTRGGRFFHGDGERTGSGWRAFRGALALHVSTMADEDIAILSALATFRSMRAWCVDPPPSTASPVAGAGPLAHASTGG